MSNLKIIKILSILSFVIGILTVLIFYNAASKLKFLYTDIKNQYTDGKPKAIVAKTIKGKGFSFSEGNNAWHHAVLTEKLYNLGLIECGGMSK